MRSSGYADSSGRTWGQTKPTKAYPLTELRIRYEGLRGELAEAKELSAKRDEACRELAAGMNREQQRANRYRRTLREIRDQEWVENTLDPQWAARIAEAALTTEEGESPDA